MFDIESRILSLSAWGKALQMELEKPEMEEILQSAERKNRWFIPKFSRRALESWVPLLEENALRTWVQGCEFHPPSRRVGVIAAGNIPLVGFHDVLSVLIAGHNLVLKPSSDDEVLMRFMLDGLMRTDSRFADRIEWVTGKLEGLDAVIATGSNNTARYFDYYFRNIPSIIRKNRKSIAVLSGRESEAELERLGDDIFTYFGLGCRNVSFLFVPRDFDLDRVFKAIYPYHWVVEHSKYANNYDYHRAIFMMNSDEILENGFVVVRESLDLSCPLGTLYVHRYNDMAEVNTQIEKWSDQIQVIASNSYSHPRTIDFGAAQNPELTDYADGVDVLAFLKQV